MQAGQAGSATFSGVTVGQRLYNTIEARERSKPPAADGTKDHAFVPEEIQRSLTAISTFQKRNVQPENALFLRERAEELGTIRSVFAEAMVKLKVDADTKSKMNSNEPIADRAQRFMDAKRDDLSRTRPLEDVISSALEAAEILAELEKSEGQDAQPILKRLFTFWVKTLNSEINDRIDSEIRSLESQAESDSRITHVIS